jgi:hypothetical protein
MDNQATPPTAFSALRIFSWIVLALMVITMIYAAWHSIANWTEIRV